MSELIEMVSLSQKSNLFLDLLNVWSKYVGKDYEITRIYTMDNWEYEYQIDIKDLSEIDQYLDNKIITINFMVGSDNLGIYIEKKKSLYSYDWWINPIEDISDDQYEEIKEYLSNYCSSNKEYLISAIGRELMVDFDEDIETAIEQARNVDVWIKN